ncbi:hypothetical protein ACU686_18380 [Yinghuangia aomiensis]
MSMLSRSPRPGGAAVAGQFTGALEGAVDVVTTAASIPVEVDPAETPELLTCRPPGRDRSTIRE